MAGRAPGLERNHMHELNIVTYVIDQVKEIAEQNELTEIDSVTLELGEVSGVVSDYLKDNGYNPESIVIELNYLV